MLIFPSSTTVAAINIDIVHSFLKAVEEIHSCLASQFLISVGLTVSISLRGGYKQEKGISLSFWGFAFNASNDSLSFLQAFWNKMCIMPTGDPSNAGCAEGSGLCVSPALFRLHNVQQTAGDRG